MRASVHTGSFLRSITAPPATEARIPAGNQSQHRDCIRGGRPSEAPPSAHAQCHELGHPPEPDGTIASPAKASPVLSDHWKSGEASWLAVGFGFSGVSSVLPTRDQASGARP